MDTAILKHMYEQKKNDRSNIESIWSIIEQYIVPFKAKFYTTGAQENSMEWRRRFIYDSTAVDSNQRLASHLQSGMSNSAYRWFELIFRHPVLRKKVEYVEWLSQCSEITYQYLVQSNFDLVSGEAYLDIPSFGTSVVTKENKEVNGSLKKVLFGSIPLDQAYYEMDDEGRPNFFWRQLNWTANQFVTKFGPKADLPRVVAKAFEDKKNDQTFELVYSIYPRYGKEDIDIRKTLPQANRPFGYKYFMADTGQMVGMEGGYYDMPVYVPMWRKTSRSQFGHSPGMVVLSDILTLNQLVEMILKANEKAIDPPVITTKKGTFGDVDLTPGGVTVVRDMESIAPFESKARFDVSQLTKEELRNSIKQAFFADQLELKESPEMTAAEVYTRYELLARLMGPAAGRIMYDFHSPLVKSTFDSLYRYGLLPPAPSGLADTPIDVNFIGPMARAMKLDKVNNIERYVQGVGAMSELFPDILDNVDPDGLDRQLAYFLSVPVEIRRTESKRNTVRNNRRKQESEMRQLAMMEQGAKAAKDVTPLIQGGGNGAGATAAAQ